MEADRRLIYGYYDERRYKLLIMTNLTEAACLYAKTVLKNMSSMEKLVMGCTLINSLLELNNLIDGCLD